MTDKSEIVPYGQRSTTLQMMSYLHKDRMDNDIPTPHSHWLLQILRGLVSSQFIGGILGLYAGI